MISNNNNYCFQFPQLAQQKKKVECKVGERHLQLHKERFKPLRQMDNSLQFCMVVFLRGNEIVACVTDVYVIQPQLVCEAVLRSLFRAPYRLSALLEVHFEFPFNLIGKS